MTGSDQRTLLPARWAGVLLHPTSLPGHGTIGSLGFHALQWIDWLADQGFAAWQVLPLCPPGAGNSPYASWSSMLGSPAMVDLPTLAGQGLITHIEADPGYAGSRVDFQMVDRWNLPTLARAAQALLQDDEHPLHEAFQEWAPGQPWLVDVARYAARKDAAEGKPWWKWPQSLRSRDPFAMQLTDRALFAAIENWKVRAFLFDWQWSAVRERARSRGVVLIGDLPIYVSADSADVWSRPELFLLDERGRPKVVAGCPPDAFSELGQRWGNPMYSWPNHASEGFEWWITRLQRTLAHVDMVRIDHFRGFSAGWAIPASAPDARSGQWVQAPGEALFAMVRRALGGLPFIAEDLGHLDEAVHALRAATGLPGTRVLQFGFDGNPYNPHHPDRVDRNAVAYTGTHDNDTTVGWFTGLDGPARQRVERDLGCTREDVADSLIGAALDCVASGTVIPAQDLLGLGSEARMNRPGEAEGNWAWRLTDPDMERLGQRSFPGWLREARRA